MGEDTSSVGDEIDVSFPAEDAAESANENDSGGSLTSETEETSAREAFAAFIDGDDDEEEIVEEPKEEADEPEEGEGEAEEPDEEEETSEEETEEDGDGEDLVDLSDVDLGDPDEEEEVPDDFDFKQGLAPKVWKSLPDEARELIDNQRRAGKRLAKEAEENKTYVDWSKATFDRAKEVGAQPADVETWMDLTFRMEQGDTEARDMLGNQLVKAGYVPQVGMPDLEPIKAFIKKQADELDFAPEQAKELLGMLDGVKTPVQPRETQQREAPKPPNPSEQQHALEQAAVEKLQSMSEKYEEKYGKDWPKMRKVIEREVRLAQAQTPVSPAQWPRLWAEKARQVEKDQRRAHNKGKRRLSGNSESLGSGSPAKVSESSDSKQSAKDHFYRKFTH